MTVSNHLKKKSFHQLRNRRARGQTIMNGIGIVIETETRGIPDLTRSLRKKSRDQEAESEIEIETEGSANEANRQSPTRRRIRIRTEIGIVTDGTTGKEREKGKEIATEEENATEPGIEDGVNI
jgi:hypothetical protein